jgi:type VI secretion system secreted protein VgrG
VPENVQADRPLTIDTPLGKDVVLLRRLSGREGVSQLFSFELDLLAEKTMDVAFDKVLGQKVTAHLSLPKGKRHFNGRCVRVSQGQQDIGEKTFTSYRMEIVPDFWMLTRKAQSRIFQQMSVPDILKKVLVGVDVTYEIQGTFYPRDYCVQYRETDFNFASRLMEEEGIYYFFKHTDGNHKMVVANTPQSHSDVPDGPTQIIYEGVEGGFREEDRIVDWEKVQEWRSGKYTLWDHSFELPHKHLETEKLIQDSVTVGKVSHKLKVSGNDKFEIYDWPGEYAQRFDGVDPGGGDQPGELQHIFEDNKRTVEIRMQEEALGSLVIHGGGNCRHFMAGHKFSLQRHFSGEGGPYVLTSVNHVAQGSGDYRGGQTGEFRYRNQFTCIPQALPFRPPRVTPKPVVHGTQSAVVVGPAGEEIFTDKYSRVKVQFHWDREGKYDSKSSCWIRVGTHWAGKQWGMIHIPRIGQEVIVDFQEGDPDQPIIVGSVYNADMMPPYGLPANKTQSGVKSRSSLGGGPDNFNEIRFEDKKGSEQLFIHAEKNQDIEVENDETHSVGHDRTKDVGNDERTSIERDRSESVGRNETITIEQNRKESVGGNEDISIAGNRTEAVEKSENITIGQKRVETVGKDETVQVGGRRSHEIGGDDSLQVGKKFRLSAGDEIVLQTGSASIVMKKNGDIQISGKEITINGSGKVNVKAGSDLVLKGSKVSGN